MDKINNFNWNVEYLFELVQTKIKHPLSYDGTTQNLGHVIDQMHLEI